MKCLFKPIAIVLMLLTVSSSSWAQVAESSEVTSTPEPTLYGVVRQIDKNLAGNDSAAKQFEEPQDRGSEPLSLGFAMYALALGRLWIAQPWMAYFPTARTFAILGTVFSGLGALLKSGWSWTR
jgi:hypothetical protein